MKAFLAINLPLCLLLVACTSLQPNQDSGPSKVLFQDDMMGDWQENWFLDGREATLEHRNEGLYFSGGTITKPMDREKYHAHHAVLWTKQVFEGDLRISFEMTRVDDGVYGNTLLYMYAQGIGTEPYAEDITEWNEIREVPAMNKYFTYMDLLSLSFRHNLRARRYPLKSIDPDAEAVGGTARPYVDYEGILKDKPYRVVVEKRGPDLRIRLSEPGTGELVVEHTWEMTKLDGGKEAPVLHKGRIGLRHMSTKQFIYKDFKVERL